MSSGSKDQLVDLGRELTKKIAKAKPVVLLVERGELKTLNAEEQRLVQSYPKWVEDLELVRKGVMPSKVSPQAQAPPSPSPQPQSSTPPLAPAEPPEPTPETNRPSRNGSRKEKQEPTPTKKPEPRLTAQQKHSKMLEEIRQADPKARNALVEAYVATKVDRSKMQALAKEYDSICTLRRDILSGKIATPTKMQNNRIGLLAQLEREMDLERGQLTKQSVKQRGMLFAELGIEDVQEPDEADEAEEPSSAVASAIAVAKPSPDEEKRVEEPPLAACETPEDQRSPAKVDLSASKTPEVLSHNGDGSTTETPRKEAEEDGDQLAEEVRASRETESTGVSDAGEVAEVLTSAHQQAPEPEVEQEPVPEVPRVPSPPKELDWSVVSIQKNRPKPSKRVDGESATPSPEPAEKVDPTAITKIIIGAPSTNATAGAASVAKAPKAEAAAQGKKGDEKKGKGKPAVPDNKAVPASASTGGSLLQQSVVHRVQKDLAYCIANPLPNVRFNLFKDNLLVWHVNVSPTDGPLAGCFVHLEMKFGELYPLEPPTVRSFVDIPHSQIGSIDAVKNCLCLEHTVTAASGEEIDPTRGWSPIYTAFSVLMQLQSFFGAEAFAEAKKALGSSFKSRLMLCRGDLSRFSCPCGHSASKPTPAVPCFNGPFEHPPKGLVAIDGAIRCRGRAPMGHHWVHAYSRCGKHSFAVTVERPGGDGALIGVSTARYNGPAEQIGKHPQSIAINTHTGQLRNCGFVEEYEGPLTFPLPAFSVVEVTVDLDECVIRFETKGQLIGAVNDLNKLDHWHPAIALLSGETALSFAIPVDETGDWQYLPPPPPIQEAKNNDVICYVTKATSEEAVLGIGLEVSRGKDNMPTSIRTTGDVLSKEAAERRKQSTWGRRFDVFLPLILDGSHAARSLPLLKRAISICCRNPNAALFYDPPFKTEQALTVLTGALQGTVESCVKDKFTHAETTFRTYTKLVHCLVALALESQSIVDHAQHMLESGTSSGNVFYLSVLLLGVPWPQVVQRALSTECKVLGRGDKTFSTEEDLFVAMKPRLKQLLVAAAFSHAVRVTTLKKAYDLFLSTKSTPTAEMCDEVSHQLSTISTVTSWEALETYLKAEFTLADLLA